MKARNRVAYSWRFLIERLRRSTAASSFGPPASPGAPPRSSGAAFRLSDFSADEERHSCGLVVHAMIATKAPRTTGAPLAKPRERAPSMSRGDAAPGFIAKTTPRVLPVGRTRTTETQSVRHVPPVSQTACVVRRSGGRFLPHGDIVSVSGPDAAPVKAAGSGPASLGSPSETVAAAAAGGSRETAAAAASAAAVGPVTSRAGRTDGVALRPVADTAALDKPCAPVTRAVPRLQVAESVAEAHGTLGDAGWPLPRLVAASSALARPGYQAGDASEYLDEPDVLRAKCALIASLLRRSQATCVYTGAGISTAAGIGDYASVAPKSIVDRPATINRRKAQPTFAHWALAALERAGLVHEWVQQNHDGLAQKAGYPAAKLNEIHGSWFDRDNPVVLMDGEVRADLFRRLLEWEQRAELTLAMGSSLCGMNADRIACTPARKAAAGLALGLVVVNLQRTRLDGLAAVRVFAKCDDFMRELMRQLRLSVRLPKALLF